MLLLPDRTMIEDHHHRELMTPLGFDKKESPKKDKTEETGKEVMEVIVEVIVEVIAGVDMAATAEETDMVETETTTSDEVDMVAIAEEKEGSAVIAEETDMVETEEVIDLAVIAGALIDLPLTEELIDLEVIVGALNEVVNDSVQTAKNLSCSQDLLKNLLEELLQKLDHLLSARPSLETKKDTYGLMKKKHTSKKKPLNPHLYLNLSLLPQVPPRMHHGQEDRALS